MGEAILVKAGGGYSGGTGNNSIGDIIGWRLKSDIITTNQTYSVPKAKNQEFSVRIFGGGAGGNLNSFGISYPLGIYNLGTGGGGGNMNNNTLTLNEGEQIEVRIGIGGGGNSQGGTTSFGTYLSATGGCTNGLGGTGGGGYYVQTGTYSSYDLNGGKGIYGGGGGGWYGGAGGIYGGAGGAYNVSSGTNGTNTLSNIDLDFVGEGRSFGAGSGGYGGSSGYKKASGGGGYGGNGGNGFTLSSIINTLYAGGGGGGYGGKGGDGFCVYNSPNNTAHTSNFYAMYGGGGGGYGPDNYGSGGDGNGNSGKNGICLINYYEPVYKT